MNNVLTTRTTWKHLPILPVDNSVWGNPKKTGAISGKELNKKMKLYDQVKSLLIKYPELRSDDKKLIWAVWNQSGFIENGAISKDKFYDAPLTKSIVRARAQVQNNDRESGNLELQPTEEVAKLRRELEKEKGTHVYRETTPFSPHKRFEVNDSGQPVVVDCSCQIGHDH